MTGIHCVHYIEKNNYTAGLDAGGTICDIRTGEGRSILLYGGGGGVEKDCVNFAGLSVVFVLFLGVRGASSKTIKTGFNCTHSDKSFLFQDKIGRILWIASLARLYLLDLL